jgi:hypothetical protein
LDPKRDEMTRGWRKLIEYLHDVFNKNGEVKEAGIDRGI